MSCFTQYKLKDGRKIKGRYDSKSTKVCISRSDLEKLIYEVDIAYDQAEQLQTIIENLQEIKKQATVKALNKIKAEIKQYAQQPAHYPVNMISIATVLQIIDRHKTESKDIETQA